MTLDPLFKTKTMARIFADQGQLNKAAEIYLFLLAKEPHREDLAAALDAVRQRMREGQRPEKDLAPLYEKWLRLAYDCHKERLLQRGEG